MSQDRHEEAARTLRFTLGAAQGLGLVSYGLLAVFTLTSSTIVGIETSHRPALLVYGLTGIFMATHTENSRRCVWANRLPLGFAVTVAGALTRLAALTVIWLSGGGLLAVALAFVAEPA